jgi:hypothetical protein
LLSQDEAPIDLSGSPDIDVTMSTPNTEDEEKNQFGDLNLSITGLGVEYPPFLLEPSALDTLCTRHYPDSPA